jgi:predicted transposase YbfD/YdcC
MTRTDARVGRPIIPDPSRPGPTYSSRPENADAPHLLAQLASVPDPGAIRGRHPLVAILAMAAAAVLAGAICPCAPEEVTAFAPLLAPLDLAEVVVTTDALQTRPGAAEFLVASKQAHYLFVVDANQSTLLDRCQRLPWHRVPQLDRTRDRGHGRIELRTLKADSIHANIQQHHRKHPQPPADRHGHNNPAQHPRTTAVSWWIWVDSRRDAGISPPPREPPVNNLRV